MHPSLRFLQKNIHFLKSSECQQKSNVKPKPYFIPPPLSLIPEKGARRNLFLISMQFSRCSISLFEKRSARPSPQWLMGKSCFQTCSNQQLRRLFSASFHPAAKVDSTQSQPALSRLFFKIFLIFPTVVYRLFRCFAVTRCGECGSGDPHSEVVTSVLATH